MTVAFKDDYFVDNSVISFSMFQKWQKMTIKELEGEVDKLLERLDYFDNGYNDSIEDDLRNVLNELTKYIEFRINQAATQREF